MSDAIHDMEAFSKMTDHVFFMILNSTDPKLQESREILSNILQRKLYKCVGQTQLRHDQVFSKVWTCMSSWPFYLDEALPEVSFSFLSLFIIPFISFVFMSIFLCPSVHYAFDSLF